MKKKPFWDTMQPLEVALKCRLPGLSLDPLDQPERWGEPRNLLFKNISNDSNVVLPSHAVRNFGLLFSEHYAGLKKTN